MTVSYARPGGGNTALPIGEAVSAAHGEPARRRPAGERALSFAIRTTIAALLALALAQGLKIAHPWWAAMTVWLVAQPTRGLLIERSVARLAGTIAGAAAGGALLYLAPSLPVTLAALLLWIALCAGLGSLFRHFRNYGLVLAGYTAAIVVMFAEGEAALNPNLPFDRVWCTLIGILCSALASIRVAPGQGVADLDARLDELVQSCLDRAEAHLRQECMPATGNMLLTSIAALDRLVDGAAAGSLRGRRAALRVRRCSGLLLELVALTPDGAVATVPRATAAAYGCVRDNLSRLIALAGRAQDDALGEVLAELARALETPGAPILAGMMREVDIGSALRAAARPAVALSLAAAIWLASGWQYGFVMAMTATLFASLFSSHDQGNQALLQVLNGSLAGAVVGIAVRQLLLPHAAGIIGILLCVAPVLLAGAWLMRHASTAKMAIDLNMTFLLASQPGAAPVDQLTAYDQVAAIFVGVLIAAVTFWLILPANPRARRRQLAGRVAGLADGTTGPATRSGGIRCFQTTVERHQALRGALVRLLDVSDPGEPCFAAARDSLVRSRRALAGRETASPSNTTIKEDAP